MFIVHWLENSASGGSCQLTALFKGFWHVSSPLKRFGQFETVPFDEAAALVALSSDVPYPQQSFAVGVRRLEEQQIEIQREVADYYRCIFLRLQFSLLPSTDRSLFRLQDGDVGARVELSTRRPLRHLLVDEQINEQASTGIVDGRQQQSSSFDVRQQSRHITKVHPMSRYFWGWCFLEMSSPRLYSCFVISLRLLCFRR